MTLAILSTAIAFAYALIILLYRRMWKQAPGFVMPAKATSTERVTVIVPCRNEALRIGSCIEHLLGQDYPVNLLEIIVIDDHSTDGTAAVVAGYCRQGVRLIRLTDVGADIMGKKAAISCGVAAATGQIILATDADCMPPSGWVKTMTACRRSTDAAFLGGPVMFQGARTPLDIFQTLDFLSLQGITAASVSAGFHGMSNGANMAFTREAFEAVKGYADIDHIASGDDMLLMQKIDRKFPGRTSYCLSPDAIVPTKPEPTMSAFLRQRIRWASKARYYSDKRILPVLTLVYLHNLSLLWLLVAGICGYGSLLTTGLCLIGLKTLVELVFLWPVAGFFRQRRLLLLFPVAQPFHLVYTVVSGLFGQFGSYRWKDRTVH